MSRVAPPYYLPWVIPVKFLQLSILPTDKLICRIKSYFRQSIVTAISNTLVQLHIIFNHLTLR